MEDGVARKDQHTRRSRWTDVVASVGTSSCIIKPTVQRLPPGCPPSLRPLRPDIEIVFDRPSQFVVHLPGRGVPSTRLAYLPSQMSIPRSDRKSAWRVLLARNWTVGASLKL